MGILDALLRFQQQPPMNFNGGFGAGVQALPQAQMPALTQMQTPASFAFNPMATQPQAMPAQQQQPNTQMQALPQQQPQAMRVQSPWQRGMQAAFGQGQDGGWNRWDTAALGLSMLGASQGGNWGDVAQSLQNQRRDVRERQYQQRTMRREDASDARETEQFGWQRSQYQQQQDQIQRWQQAVASEADPQRRAQLQAIGPQGYADYIQGQQEQQWRSQEAQANRDFQAREGALDRRNAQSVAASQNSLGRAFQTRDAESLYAANESGRRLQTVALPQLRTLRENIVRAGQMALPGQAIDANTRITLGRVFNGSAADRQALETWRARVFGPAIESLRGLGPMSERELEGALNSFANPDQTLGAALELIDEKISTAERQLAETQAMNQFFTESGGITGRRNPAGQDYTTFLQERLTPQQEAAQAQGEQTSGGSRSAGVTYSDRLPPPRDLAVGTTATDGQYTMVVVRGPRGNQWVRQPTQRLSRPSVRGNQAGGR